MANQGEVGAHTRYGVQSYHARISKRESFTCNILQQQSHQCFKNDCSIVCAHASTIAPLPRHPPPSPSLPPTAFLLLLLPRPPQRLPSPFNTCILLFHHVSIITNTPIQYVSPPPSSPSVTQSINPRPRPTSSTIAQSPHIHFTNSRTSRHQQGYTLPPFADRSTLFLPQTNEQVYPLRLLLPLPHANIFTSHPVPSSSP